MSDFEYRRRRWSDYQTLLFRRNRQDGFPISTWELAVAAYLFDKDYPVFVACDILEYAHQVGSFELCEQLKKEDYPMAEQLLPDAPSSAWLYHDRWTWSSIHPIDIDKEV